MEEQRKHIEQLIFSDDDTNKELGLVLLPAAGYINDLSKEQIKTLSLMFEDTLGSPREWCHHYSQLVFGFDIRKHEPRNKKHKRNRANTRRRYYDFGFMEFEVVGVNFESKEALFKVTERKLAKMGTYINKFYIYNYDVEYYLFKKFPYEIVK